MEIAGLVCFFITFFGIFAFVLYNKYRVRQLIKYSGIFFESGSINRKEFQTLVESYTSFWSYITWFPDAKLYPAIYRNEAFVNFYKRSKIAMIIASSLILSGFAGGAIIDILSK